MHGFENPFVVINAQTLLRKRDVVVYLMPTKYNVIKSWKPTKVRRKTHVRKSDLSPAFEAAKAAGFTDPYALFADRYWHMLAGRIGTKPARGTPLAPDRISGQASPNGAVRPIAV